MIKLLRLLSALVLLSLGLTQHAAAAQQGKRSQLLHAYFRLCVLDQVGLHTTSMAGKQQADVAAQISDLVGDWSQSQKKSIRKTLTAQFGDTASTEFSNFVAEFTTAEEAQSAPYLTGLNGELGLKPAPDDYGALRAAMSAGPLKRNVQHAANLLSDVETWVDLQSRPGEVPSLEMWLTRDITLAAPVPTPAEPTDPLSALRSAEAKNVQSGPLPTDSVNPLDNFGEMRNARRESAIAEAREGMKQLAAERRAFEEELGAKRSAAAQSEAAAVKRQAQSIADAEKDAIEQRKNSWGTRLKTIMGATISATGGALLGGIGTRAGQEAADALFN